MTSGSLPSLEKPAESLSSVERPAESLPSVQNYKPYIIFQVPRIFCLWLVIRTYILPGFFSGNLLILSVNGNTCPSIHILVIILYFYFSCETTLLMLSCDCIESAKFIHSTLLTTKLVYYTTRA